MAQGSTVRIHGYREFVKAASKADKDTKKFVRDALKETGEGVRSDAARNLADLSPRSAEGYRVFVRARGVGVEQKLRKVTGKRSDWGVTQMKRALVPALDENEADVIDRMEKAIDKVADRFAS